MNIALIQRPLLRSMSLALLLEGVLVATAAVLLSHQLSKATRPAPPPQMVSLVAPEPPPVPAPLPAPAPPVKAPAPVPPPAMHNVPRPAPAPHVTAVPPPPADDTPSPLNTATENHASPTPAPQAAAPAASGPNPVDLFAAQLRAAVQSAVLYPYALKKMGQTGQVPVGFDYLDGHLSNIHVVHSSGVSAFDHAAMAAVESAPLPPEPAALLGHMHGYQVTVLFRLD